MRQQATLLGLLNLLAHVDSHQDSAAIIVHADIGIANISAGMIAAGIEDVNHELVGGIYSQMVWGESLEEPAGPDGVSGSAGHPSLTWTANPAYATTSCYFEAFLSDAWTGNQSQLIATPAGGMCGIMNRGLDAQGLYLQSGSSYVGYLFAMPMVAGGQPLTVTVGLYDTKQNTSVARPQTLTVTPGSNWTQYNFTLVPTSDSTCYSDPNPVMPCSSNAENLCISCSGALTVTLSAQGSTSGVSVLLDQIFLSLPSSSLLDGQPTRNDVAALVGSEGWSGIDVVVPGMGLNTLRFGGSAILVDQYRWKRFRGPASSRQPYDGWWYPYSSSGWGMFEHLELCEALNISYCVVTMNSAETPQDVSDFLEYSYGDASSTTWGAQRAADGRAAPYSPFWIEIGNEQEHTDPTFIVQVATFASALNATAARLQLPFRLQVVIGALYGTWPPQQAIPMATAVQNLTSSFDFYWDFHINADSPNSDPDVAYAFLWQMRALFLSIGSPIRGVVLEENGGRHDMQRALGHARNSNRLRCLGDFMFIESAANGLQVLGRNDNGWDQGQVFITQGPAGNMSSVYLSPAGYAQIVLSQTELPGDVVLAVDASGVQGSGLDVIALRDPAGTHVTVRIVNPWPTAASPLIAIEACSVTNTSASVVMLAGPPGLQNTPYLPSSVSPVFTSVQVPNGIDPSFEYSVPAYSFTSITVECTAPAPLRHASSGDVSDVQGTTCAAPSGPNFAWAGHNWTFFNSGPWLVSSDGTSVSLPCNTYTCYDEALLTDAALPNGSGSVTWAAVDVSIGIPPNPNAFAVMDAGLLMRCIPAGIGPGMDAFNCYEISLIGNSGGAGTGSVVIGAHSLPGNYQQLARINYDVPLSVAHQLNVSLTVSDASTQSVTFDVYVDGQLATTYVDYSFVEIVQGGNIAIRSFYADTQFTRLQTSPLQPTAHR